MSRDHLFSKIFAGSTGPGGTVILIEPTPGVVRGTAHYVRTGPVDPAKIFEIFP
jgi:hypothetical protein